MRISDWSSDVCSSDLPGTEERLPVVRADRNAMPDGRWRGAVAQAAQAGPARGGVLWRPRFVQDRLLCRAQLRRRVHAAAGAVRDQQRLGDLGAALGADRRRNARSEEETSELQSL